MANKRKSIYDYITISYYRYAPESFKVYFNRARINLNPEEINRCGRICCCKGMNEALEEVKRIIRNKVKNKKEFCTIGFRNLDNNSDYFYTKQLIANRNNLREKLRVYKEFKEYLLQKDCKIASVTTTKLGAGYKEESQKVEYSHVDINKPVIIIF